MIDHEKVKAYSKDYKAGKLVIPNVQWHKENTDIDLKLQNSQFVKKLTDDGFTILANVDIEVLFNEMTKSDADGFRRKKMFGDSSNEFSLTSVLDCWYAGQKLIPPTIIIFDQKYIDEICPSGDASTEFRPIDGKHRLKIAYWAGVKTVPILVLKRQFDTIKDRLGL